MSTTPQHPVAATPAVPPPDNTPDEIRVYSHSNVFYWWPVWAIGFLMGLWTLFGDGHHLVPVPADAEAYHVADVKWTTVQPAESSDKVKETVAKEAKDRDVIVLPPATEKQKQNKIVGDLPRETPENVAPKPIKRLPHIAHNSTPGVVFCAVLLLVITITNVPLRGMWSILVIITLALLAVILALLGMWERIVNVVSLLDIRINAGGYFFISGVLFAIWAGAVFAFDRQTYIIFSPGQFKVCQAIGDAETAYDATGLSVQKQRSDLFRHYILGLGSGDLVVKTTGAQAHHFELPNVLFLGLKTQQIENVVRKRPQVSSPAGS